jgi:hypothetical protein
MTTKLLLVAPVLILGMVAVLHNADTGDQARLYIGQCVRDANRIQTGNALPLETAWTIYAQECADQYAGK